MTGSFGSPFSHLEKKMPWTYGEVMAALGDEAQPVPGGILVFREKHIMVGLCHGGGGFDVTPEGMDILNEFEEPVVAPRARKAKAKPAPTSALAVDLDDLGAGM
jgi:hypothetical protein